MYEFDKLTSTRKDQIYVRGTGWSSWKGEVGVDLSKWWTTWRQVKKKVEMSVVMLVRNAVTVCCGDSDTVQKTRRMRSRIREEQLSSGQVRYGDQVDEVWTCAEKMLLNWTEEMKGWRPQKRFIPEVREEMKMVGERWRPGQMGFCGAPWRTTSTEKESNRTAHLNRRPWREAEADQRRRTRVLLPNY